MINATWVTLSQGTFEFFCTKQCKWKWSHPSNSLSTLGCSFWIEKLHLITIYFHFPLFWEILVCVKTPLALLSHPWTPAGAEIPKWLGWAGPLGRALSLHPISQPRPPGWIDLGKGFSDFKGEGGSMPFEKDDYLQRENKFFPNNK